MKLRINLDDRSYNCIIENNILKNLTEYIESDRKVLIILDNNVDISFLGNIKRANLYIEKFTANEHSKSLASYQHFLEIMLKYNFSRKDYVVSIGGGITGDLGGFVAASYKRGCNFINCPTTTLSMIDSSVGGKVAVNLNNVKNAVGAFYQPKVVLIDPVVLKTLPKRHFNNGLVEALKMGLIGDEYLYQLFLNNDIDIQNIIYKSLDLKRKVVEEDEKEIGLRKILNFGHTIGHAIESLNLDQIYHGEAVGLGMLYMIQDSSIKEEVKNILIRLNAYYDIECSSNDLLPLIMNDKKAENDTVDIVVINKVGEAIIEKIDMNKMKDIIDNN